MTHRDLDSLLRQLAILGTLAVVLIPAARGNNAWFGWLPLWLVGLPLAAWLGWHGLQRLDRGSMPASDMTVARGRRRAVPVQARRRRAVRVSPKPHRHLPSA